MPKSTFSPAKIIAEFSDTYLMSCNQTAAAFSKEFLEKSGSLEEMKKAYQKSSKKTLLFQFILFRIIRVDESVKPVCEHYSLPRATVDRMINSALFKLEKEDREKGRTDSTRYEMLKTWCTDNQEKARESEPEGKKYDEFFEKLYADRYPFIASPREFYSYISWEKKSLWVMQEKQEGFDVKYKVSEGKKEDKHFEFHGLLETVGQGIHCILRNAYPGKKAEEERITFTAPKSHQGEWSDFMIGFSTCFYNNNDSVRSYKRIIIAKALLDGPEASQIQEDILYYLDHDQTNELKEITTLDKFRTYVDQLRRTREDIPLNNLLSDLEKASIVTSFNTFYPERDKWYQCIWSVKREANAVNFKRLGPHQGVWYMSSIKLIKNMLYLHMTTDIGKEDRVRYFVFDFRDYLHKNPKGAVVIPGISLGLNAEKPSQLVASKEVLVMGETGSWSDDLSDEAQEINMHHSYASLNVNLKACLSSAKSSAISFLTNKNYPAKIEGEYDIYFYSYKDQKKKLKRNHLKIQKTDLKSPSHHFECIDQDKHDRYYLVEAFIDDKSSNVLYLNFWDHINDNYFSMHLTTRDKFNTPPEVLVGNLSSKSKGLDGPVAQAVLLVSRVQKKQELIEDQIEQFLSSFSNPVTHQHLAYFKVKDILKHLESEVGHKVGTQKDGIDQLAVKDHFEKAYHQFVEHQAKTLIDLKNDKKITSRFLGTYKIFFNLVLQSLSQEIRNLDLTDREEAPATYSVVMVDHFWDSLGPHSKNDFKGDSPEHVSVKFPATINRIFKVDGKTLNKFQFEIIRDHYQFLKGQRKRKKTDGNLNLYVCFLQQMDNADRENFEQFFFIENITYTYYQVDVKGGRVSALNGLTRDKDKYEELKAYFNSLVTYDQEMGTLYTDDQAVFPIDDAFIKHWEGLIRS